MAIDFSSERKISAALKKGQLTEKQLVKEYDKMRKTIMRQISRIQKSATPFTRGNVPRPPTVKELTGHIGIDRRALVREIVEMQRFKSSKRYSLKTRAETRKKTLETLRAHGIHIKDSQYNKWVDFITWFRQSAWAALYDSDSEVVMEVFEEGSSAAEWNALFREYGGQ